MSNNYRILTFLARYGTAIAALGALAPVAAAICPVVAGGSPLWLAAGGAAGLFVFLLLKSYAEMAALIIEMLLPK